MTLLGEIRRIGMAAPDFSVVDAELRQLRLSDFRGEKVLVNSFPSLDLPAAGSRLGALSNAAGRYGGIRMLAVSMDLPFAFRRLARTVMTGVTPLSDYPAAEFGTGYGLLMRECRLLARAVLAIDEGGRLRHQEIAAEATEDVDMDAALRSIVGFGG
jgi:thiol peroxidase